MTSFTKPLIVKKIDKGWVVQSNFEYHVGEEGSHERIKIPIGFCTDFASVPRLFWMIIPPDGRYTQAAVVHDYLYSQLGNLGKIAYTRGECDGIFLEAMKVLKVPFWKRRVMYRAVRIFGGIGWRIHKKRSEKDE